jgi:hypothetical protein
MTVAEKLDPEHQGRTSLAALWSATRVSNRQRC